MTRVLALASTLLLAGCLGTGEVSEAELRALLASSAPAPGELVVTFFATALGDALLLELPNGRTLLVDAGVGWRVEEVLAYLRVRGIRRLDALLLTHPHYDHYGGMPAVVERVAADDDGGGVGEFLSNGGGATTDRWAALEAALDARGVPRRALRRGDRVTLGEPEVVIEVLYPTDEAFEGRSDENHGTLVLRVTHGAQRLLLMGDAEREEEAALLALEGRGPRSRLRADLLKLGHHASRLSGTEAFLEAVRPRLAVAQGTAFVDIPLVYPRPTGSIEAELESMGAALLVTDELGAAQVVSDGASLRWRALDSVRRTRRQLGRAPAARS